MARVRRVGVHESPLRRLVSVLDVNALRLMPTAMLQFRLPHNRLAYHDTVRTDESNWPSRYARALACSRRFRRSGRAASLSASLK
jgi:hypothetical protein